MEPIRANSNTGFYRLPQVLERIPLSKSRWWDGVKKGEFPKPVKISARCTAWQRSDIEALCARLAGEVTQ